MAKNYARQGDAAFAKVDKINAELLTLTYGSMVSQLMKDFEDVEEVNKQLEKMGYNIGLRLVDEFLAKSGVSRCEGFKDAVEIIAKVGLKMFLGVAAEVTNWNTTTTECSLILTENPLNDFVELTEQYNALFYSNILCGVIRGALEMVQMRVECRFVKCQLRGDDVSEMRITLKEMIPEAYAGDEE